MFHAFELECLWKNLRPSGEEEKKNNENYALHDKTNFSAMKFNVKFKIQFKQK